mmetsp:Transcript_46644/g.109993  ORF Transcript_46644/g.109993 Transcript_46644/m.109993 type:complete len:303 (+) Transcript_46644:24-932(+)
MEPMWRAGGTDFAKAATYINHASSISIFTGAGISVESGIPDFRSPGGLWTKYNPYEYCDYATFKRKPELFWRMGRALILQIHEEKGGSREELLRTGEWRSAEPNAAHRALVDFEQLGKKVTVVTQNIDGLHKVAGSSRVVELHGTDQTCTCMACRETFPQAEVVKQWMALPEATRRLGPEEDGFVPCCPKTDTCSGVLKADVTFFGEALPTGALARATGAVLGSSVCIVVGTSLNVAPANLVPGLVKARWGKLIVCNLDESGKDQADVFLQGRATQTLPRLLEAVRTAAAAAPRRPAPCTVS